MAKFRGNAVEYVKHNRRDDTYSLIGEDGSLVAELKRHEFMSQPQLRTLKVQNGGHRRSHPKVYSRPAGQSYWYTSTGTLWYSTPGIFTFIGADFAERKPIENAGIRAGEIIAHRGWRLINGRLGSVYKQQHIWEPGIPMTGDVRGEYGVHAFKDASLVSEYTDFYRYQAAMHDPFASWEFYLDDKGAIRSRQKERPIPHLPIFVIGTVALWGEVIEHERGYRAEFAKIASIDRIEGGENHEDTLRELRTLYVGS